MSIIRWALSICLLLPIASPAIASTYLPVDEEAYEVLQYLEATGVIQSGLLASKPLSRKEVVRLIREAEKNSEEKGVLIKQKVEWLRQRFKDDFDETSYLKPLGQIQLEYLYSDEDPSEFVYNQDGDEYEERSNFRLGAESRGEGKRLSFYLNPEVRYSNDDTDTVLQRGYAVFSLSNLDLQIGKDSQWWGPGYHGSILLSNNAEPLTMVRLTNAEPVLLPWIFRPLGLFRFTYFVSQLEEDRDVPEAILWGLRLNFKPSPYLELGLHRTALMGGEGRSEDTRTWWKSFTGKGENDPDEEAGDQRAGYDVKITLPFDFQPMQLYMEGDGEDMGGNWPSKYAYLSGLYLPGIFNWERLDFRAEWASTHVDEGENIWYWHPVYNSGYTFKERIIGHHMGRDSRDLFFEMNYDLPKQNARIRVAWEREEHDISGDFKPTKTQASIGFRVDAMKDLRLEGTYTYGTIRDALDANDENVRLFSLKLKYSL